MTTNWAFARNVTQSAEVVEHAKWRGEDTGFSGIKSDLYGAIGTESDLYHTANLSINDRRTKTYYLYLSNFNFLNVPDTISGVEAVIEMQRRGRITDETIQLRYNDEFIGINKADFKLDIIKTFGGETDTWGANLTRDMILDPSFGIGVRFQSHPNWPHRDRPLMYYIKLRIW